MAPFPLGVGLQWRYNGAIIVLVNTVKCRSSRPWLICIRAPSLVNEPTRQGLFRRDEISRSQQVDADRPFSES